MICWSLYIFNSIYYFQASVSIRSRYIYFHSVGNQANIIEAFNSTSRYLDDLLNIDNPCFEGMVNQIYPPLMECLFLNQLGLLCS